MAAVRNFLEKEVKMYFFNPEAVFTRGAEMPLEKKVEILKEKIDSADAVVVGAGSGLSTAAGYVYSGGRMEKYFGDFMAKYGFSDMYSGGFYPYGTLEEFWGFWCRNIWINRYAPVPSGIYGRLLNILSGKDYFVLTTNVDHCFQRAGFDKSRLFYTQGDYGLFQSSEPHGNSAKKTYDNFEAVRRMVLSEGFEIDGNGNLYAPEGRKIRMEIPTDLLPVCPDDGKPMTTNLRCDDFFVEDAGWDKAQKRYSSFLDSHKDARVLYLELGVGMNTPVIIKFPFWRLTHENKNAFYACVNKGEAGCAENIARRSVCIDSGIGEVLDKLEELGEKKNDSRK